MNDEFFNENNHTPVTPDWKTSQSNVSEPVAPEPEAFPQNASEPVTPEPETSSQNASEPVAPEPVVSEPYRYKYENGEKYDTYNYTSSYHTYGTCSTTADTVSPKKKKHPFLKAVKWVACAACFGVIAGAAFWGTSYAAKELFGVQLFGIQSADSANSPDTGSDGVAVSANGTPVNITLGTASTIEGVENPAENVVVQVVEQNLAGTVAVTSTVIETTSFWGQRYQEEARLSGSGFIVGKNDTELLIATNNHVVADSTKIEVTFIDDAVLEASVKGTDANADLAIIAVPLETITNETLSAIRIVTLGNSDDLRLGEMAIAIGNALGYGQSVTVGYISAIDRTVTVDGNQMTLLQTDAAINGGNSGGPLFNTKGEVIAINTAKYADTDVEGMCFAIPISRAIPILNELMTRETLTEEEQGFLGVSSRSVSSDMNTYYGWPIGAYINSIVEGSPAEQCGLYVGDIVTAVNSISISTNTELVSAISSYRYGTTVELTVQRMVNGKYEEIKLNATLAKKADYNSDSTQQSGTSNNSQNDSGENSKRPR